MGIVFNRRDSELEEALAALVDVASELRNNEIAEAATGQQMRLQAFVNRTIAPANKETAFGNYSIAGSLPLQLASAFEGQGKPEKAIQTLQDCLKTSSDTYIQIRVLVMIGDINYRRRNYGQAEKFYRRSLALSKSYSEVRSEFQDSHKADYFGELNRLAEFLASLNRWTEAETQYESLLTVMESDYKNTLPDDFEWFRTIYDHYVQTNQNERAAKLNERRFALKNRTNEWLAYNIIDKGGHRLSRFPFEKAEDMKEGLAQVELFNRSGFVDENCKLVIPLAFRDATSFGEGLAAAQPNHSFPDHLNKTQVKWGFINRLGKFQIEPKFECTTAFSEGLAATQLNSGYDSWCYIDKAGAVRIKPGYTEAGNFDSGEAPVLVGAIPGVRGCIGGDYGGTWVQIDRQGKVISTMPTSPGPGERSDSMRPYKVVVKGRELWGYRDSNGRTVITPKYDEAKAFAGGWARVLIKDSWTFIDKYEKFIRADTWDDARGFEDGCAVVAKGDKYGVIDSQGKLIVEPQYEEIEKFSEGLAAVKLNGKFGYIDRAGQLKIQCQFSGAGPQGQGGPFKEGLAACRDYQTHKVGYINKNGAWVIKPQFWRAHDFSGGCAVIEEGYDHARNIHGFEIRAG